MSVLFLWHFLFQKTSFDREQIYSKAEELQSAVREKQAQGENYDSEQKKLLRVKELIRAYEKIAEGNYIDDLVRAQRERDKHSLTINLIDVTRKTSP